MDDVNRDDAPRPEPEAAAASSPASPPPLGAAPAASAEPAAGPAPAARPEPAAEPAPAPPAPRAPWSIEPPEVPIEVPQRRLAAQTRRSFLLFTGGVIASAIGAWWLLPDMAKRRLAGDTAQDRL